METKALENIIAQLEAALDTLRSMAPEPKTSAGEEEMSLEEGTAEAEEEAEEGGAPEKKAGRALLIRSLEKLD